jgi:phage tail-like protein
MAANDPLRSFNYRLEMDGVVQAGFSEIALGDSIDNPGGHRGGNVLTPARKLRGRGNVILKRGIIASIELSNWVHMTVDAVMPLGAARRNVVIRVLDETGADQAAFEIIRAWPTKYVSPGLNGKGSEVAIESLELVHEGICRTR